MVGGVGRGVESAAAGGAGVGEAAVAAVVTAGAAAGGAEAGAAEGAVASARPRPASSLPPSCLSLPAPVPLSTARLGHRRATKDSAVPRRNGDGTYTAKPGLNPSLFPAL